MSTRRQLITLLGGAAAAWPLAARAQQTSKLPTIGFLGESTPSSQGSMFAAFVQRLRELSRIEGRPAAIAVRWGKGVTSASPNSRQSSFGLGLMSVSHRELQISLRQNGPRQLSQLCSQPRGTPLAAVWSRAWHSRAATSPAC